MLVSLILNTNNSSNSRGFMRSFSVTLLVCGINLMLSACSEKPGDKGPKKLAGPSAEAEKIYTKNCKVCHAQGLNGAPILGNAKMWADRASKGKDTLVNHAVNGFGLMPAKGGKTDLSDEDVELVVNFMLSKLPNK